MTAESDEIAINGKRKIFYWLRTVLEAAAIFGIYFVFAASSPPNVNESHYLTKTKHYWNPEWCPDDLFLSSGDAHLVFYWAIGWLTLFCSLSTTAWIGRLLVWGLTAIAWQRLSYFVIPRACVAPISAGFSLLLMNRMHMAGEWMIGGIEAKGFAFAFVLFALAEIVQNKWKWAWVLLGIASAFHVLVGGWSVIAAAVAWLLTGKSRMPIKQMLPFLVLGFVCSLPGLIPAASLTWGSDAETVSIANQIYTYGRLKHHLVFSAFEVPFVIRHGCLAITWLVLAVLARKSASNWRFNAFVLGTALIAICGIAIDQIILIQMENRELAAKLLRFYLFRMSDIMIPIGAAFSLLTCMFLLQRIGRFGWVGKLIAPAACVLLAVAIGGELWIDWQTRSFDPRPPADQKSVKITPVNRETVLRGHQDWLKVCAWIEQNTPSDAAFITPRDQQTFKWYAGRAEVVNGKDIPQDAQRIKEWQKRFQEIYPVSSPYGVLALKDQILIGLGKKYGADYLIIDRQEALNRFLAGYPPTLQKEFPEKFDDCQFIVYRLAPEPNRSSRN